MNYTVLLFGIFGALCTVMWYLDARKSYSPPSFDEFVDNVAPAEEREVFTGTTRRHSYGDKRGES